MTGIDSALASMLASRIDSLLDSVGAGSRASPAQSGATGLTVDTPASADAAAALGDASPPASAQAILSEVALTLDAISRFGGEATPALIGEAPIWPAPPAIDTSAAKEGLFTANGGAASPAGGAASSASSAFASSASSASGQTGAATGATGVGAAATAMPVDALAAALEQTVNESGLFYESHLAQWLSGDYSAEALAREPQTRLAAQALQLPLDWGDGTADSSAALASAWAGAGTGTGDPAAAGWALHALPPQLSLPWFGAKAQASGAPYSNGAAGDHAWRGASAGSMDDAGLGGARSPGLAPDLRASIAASLHPATIPLVRQQLDLLATQQFRWTGEVWPGAKLDWTIEPERERQPRSGDAPDGESQQTWRTRVTLALPTLGTVDADLVLTGAQLVVRVQASPGGAARLSSGGAAFGRRLQAAGIELAGLQIREIGGAAPAAAGSASTATSAYARAAADAQARETTDDVSDVEVREGALGASERGPADAAAKRGGVASPIDRLFDDPFEWSGA
ncbi:flagellar hook-length control protein FliK [Trinickia sp. Y13]|uniref:flagellar hook-length control protein FliK n=1 Tax=Trinickia sp. Y13 TaxID=2917807 RepID=UPI002405C136|nr:flagellar hook-length control protein FliK [Trinickia sp. Y13]MDG0026802.1 flagellar hook-length control protein FliK [Trinickia sp. Y13]